MRRHSQRPEAKKRIAGAASFSLRARCSQLGSLVSVAWIILLLLHSELTHSDENQDGHSESLSWLKEVEDNGEDCRFGGFSKDAATPNTSGLSNEEEEDVTFPTKEEENVAMMCARTADGIRASEELDEFPSDHHDNLSPGPSGDFCYSTSPQDILLNLLFPVCPLGSFYATVESSRRKDHLIPTRVCMYSSENQQSNDSAGQDAMQGFDSAASNGKVTDRLDGRDNSTVEGRNDVNELEDGDRVAAVKEEQDEVQQVHGVPRTTPADENGTTIHEELRKEVLNESSSVISSKIRKIRQEPGGGAYNYASDSKGAKILASNKEAKGASNILNKDKDKYLRNPCSVENKFVDIELSEKTLVDTVAIANHEFYSSNLKRFELLGSSMYPTEAWLSLGKFEADNIRMSQKFAVIEPKWVRYLRLQMLSHYGSEFYCTLSVVEVYGSDAMEELLEDWIAEEAETGMRVPHVPLFSQEENNARGVKPGGASHPPYKLQEKQSDFQGESGASVLKSKGDDTTSATGGEEPDLKSDGYVPSDQSMKGSKVDKLQQPIHLLSGRPGLDAAMKLLMQKVRSLEHSQPLYQRYLEEQNIKYKEGFSHFDKELGIITAKLGDLSSLLATLTERLNDMELNEQRDREFWEANLSNHLKRLNADFELLRFQLTQKDNKEMMALTIALLCIISVVITHVLMNCLSLLRIYKVDSKKLSMFNHALSFLPFVSCSLVVIVLSL